jgi:type III secretory pathway component EscS
LLWDLHWVVVDVETQQVRAVVDVVSGTVAPATQQQQSAVQNLLHLLLIIIIICFTYSCD